MKNRKLGKTNLEVSEIGYGCWGIGGKMWQKDDSESRSSLRKAYDLGVNFYDTAWVYGDGHSEKLVGELSKERNLIIATKVPPKDRMWPASHDSNIKDVFPKDYIIDYAKKSYANVGRKIDILQLHVWSDNWIDSHEWQDAFIEIKKMGIADHFGVSVNDHQPESVIKLTNSGKISTLQVIYNIFDQSPADELFDLALKNNVGIIVRVPFDEGSLAGKFTYETKFDDWRSHYFGGEKLKLAVDKVEELRFLETDNRSLAQAALQFCLAHPAVSTVIPGMRKTQHVIENIKAAEDELTKEELQELKKHRWVRDFYKGLH